MFVRLSYYLGIINYGHDLPFVFLLGNLYILHSVITKDLKKLIPMCKNVNSCKMEIISKNNEWNVGHSILAVVERIFFLLLNNWEIFSSTWSCFLCTQTQIIMDFATEYMFPIFLYGTEIKCGTSLTVSFSQQKLRKFSTFQEPSTFPQNQAHLPSQSYSVVVCAYSKSKTILFQSLDLHSSILWVCSKHESGYEFKFWRQPVFLQ